MKYILNFGGGINSCALYFVIREHALPLDEIIFADTGSELPETYLTVAKFMDMVEKDGITFTTVKAGYGNLYDYYMKAKTVPSRMRRDCTGKFKVAPIRKHMREKYGKQETFTNYIGIAFEELHRMRTSNVKYCTNAYPLVDFGIDRNKCIEILKQNGIENVIKSGCFMCPFTRKQGWKDLLEKHPELFEKAIEMEMNCPNKKTGLASIPLSEMKKKIQNMTINQSKLTEYEATCDVAGSCFL